MIENFDACLRRLLAHEGGYSNHPSDPGGPTNFGITIADYRRYAKPGATEADVKAMRLDEAKAIYKARYWEALWCDRLPAGVDYTAFDYGVNSGIARSGKVLRRVLGLSDSDYRVAIDVLAALAERDSAAIIVAINDERLRFLKSLKTWPVFGAGWTRRVNDVRVRSLAMARSNDSPSAPSAGPGVGAAEVKCAAAGKGQAAARNSTYAGAAGGAAITAGGAIAIGAGQVGADPATLAVTVPAALLAGALAWAAIYWWRKRRQERAAARV